MKLKTKFAIVTGASTGIGRAIAIELGRNSANTVLIARSKDKLEAVKGLIEKQGGTAQVIQGDLSDIMSINLLISQIKSLTGRIDALINVAGVWHGQNEVYADVDFEKYEQQVILDTYSVGLTAPTLLVHGLLPFMTQGSSIINLSGTFENGAKGWLPYFVSKRAMEDLTVGLAQELEEKKIKVYGISPSDTNTKAYAKYFPQYVQEAIAPEEIAKFTYKLVCDNEKSGNIYILKKGHKPTVGFHI